MPQMLKPLLKKVLWPVIAFYRLVWSRHSYLHTTGWVESVKRGYPCTPDGNEVPWMNHGVIKLLQQRLSSDLSLFEFGSGFSTVFYARLVDQVISIEYDKKWLDIMAQKLPGNATVVYKQNDSDGQYCRTINQYSQPFDVVIVDGRDRVNCVKQAINKLTERGVIILDDSNRPRYQAGIDHAKALGFRELTIEGLKPTGSRMNQTTFLYRDGNCLAF
jgi:hypothetical protein